MPVLERLLADIAADPDDRATQLVLADVLVAAGDPRGELIALALHERALDAEGRESLLLLAAEYGFPVTPEPDEAILPYRIGCQGYPMEYFFDHGGYTFHVRYRHGSLSISENDDRLVTGVDYPDGFDAVGVDYLEGGTWTDDEAAETLAVISDALRYGTPLDQIWLPAMTPPPPVYPGAARRIYRLPEAYTQPRNIPRDRYGLAARDRVRWLALWERHASAR